MTNNLAPTRPEPIFKRSPRRLSWSLQTFLTLSKAGSWQKEADRPGRPQSGRYFLPEIPSKPKGSPSVEAGQATVYCRRKCQSQLYDSRLDIVLYKLKEQDVLELDQIKQEKEKKKKNPFKRDY